MCKETPKEKLKKKAPLQLFVQSEEDYSAEEMRAMIREAYKRDTLIAYMSVVSFFINARISEITGLLKENIDIESMLESEIGLTAQYKGVSFQTTVRTRYTQNRKIEIPCCSGIRFRYDFKCSSKMTNFLFWLVGFDFSIYKYKMTCECTSITMEDVDVSKDCPNCVPYQNKL